MLCVLEILKREVRWWDASPPPVLIVSNCTPTPSRSDESDRGVGEGADMVCVYVCLCVCACAHMCAYALGGGG